LTLALPPAAEPAVPIASGHYVFEHRFAEHPDMRSIPLEAMIDGDRIVLTNEIDSVVFPRGVVVEGRLAWHAATQQWIIAQESADANAADVGGCSDGPEVIDLEKRIYWTC
jgi:hypothetical protein